MAYTRGRADRSGGKRQRANIKERQRISQALTDLEFAKQSETRKRERSKSKGTGWGTLAAILFSGGNAAVAAALMGLGSAAGDLSYTQRSKGGQISKAQNALKALEKESLFAETRHQAELGVETAEMAKDITRSDAVDFGTLFGTDFIKWYTTLAGLDKLGTGGEGGLDKITLDKEWWKNL